MISPKQGVVSTVLSLLGSSLILGIATYLAKDTMVRVNKTIEKVQQREVKLKSFEYSINTLNDKLSNVIDNINKNTNKNEIFFDEKEKEINTIKINIEKLKDNIKLHDYMCKRIESDINSIKGQK